MEAKLTVEGLKGGEFKSDELEQQIRWFFATTIYKKWEYSIFLVN
jgi:hypothetical protein